MQTIKPYLSSLVSEKDYLDTNSLDVTPITYILANNLEVFQKTKTQAGYVISKLNSVPEDIRSLCSDIKEEASHLPGGKIPSTMLSAILSFFLHVYKTSDDEAMAHILWNTKTSSYEVGIPEQIVTKASVHYKFVDVEPHHIIIADIHSHNSMPAYWSSTDNSDDSAGVWFSGVVGTLDRIPTINWRFTDFGRFHEVEHEDIFDKEFGFIGNESKSFPIEWMDRVTFPKRGVSIVRDTEDELMYGFEYSTQGSYYPNRVPSQMVTRDLKQVFRLMSSLPESKEHYKEAIPSVLNGISIKSIGSVFTRFLRYLPDALLISLVNSSDQELLRRSKP